MLELAVGSGRIALPLAARGLDVHGLDNSTAMLDRLREKDPSGTVTTHLGDMSGFALDRRFPLVFVVFNSLFALPDQEAQVRCFGTVAEHLTEDGRFVVEAFVPDHGRFDRGQTVRARVIDADRVVLEAGVHEPVAQVVSSQRIDIAGGRVELLPVRIRYAWPAELDLMARLAGLELVDRWSGWDRAPFTATSTAHVSVYGRQR